MNKNDITPVQIIALIEDSENGGPIVILHDRSSNAVLPIWIGEPEARAISFALNNVSTPRPLTHTLLLKIIQEFGGHPSRIVIDRLERQTYFASIYIETPNKNLCVDARPSDALAVALEARIPMFVSRTIIKKAGQKNPFPLSTEGQPLADEVQFTKDDLHIMKVLLEKARERERQSL